MISMKRAGPKLCAVVLGLMAFSAAAAQAEGVWMVNGKSLNEGSKELKGTFASSSGALLGVLGANTVTFSCTAGSLVNAKLEAGLKETHPAGFKEDGTISAAAKNVKVKFSGCKTSINGTVSKTCEPFSGAEKGVIISNEGYASLREHELGGGAKDGPILVVAKTGNLLGIIHMGEACSIGEEVKVFGELAVMDAGGLEKEAKIHTIETFTALTELKISNGKSEGNATLDGQAEVELTSGEVWSGLPYAAEP